MTREQALLLNPGDTVLVTRPRRGCSAKRGETHTVGLVPFHGQCEESERVIIRCLCCRLEFCHYEIKKVDQK